MVLKNHRNIYFSKEISQNRLSEQILNQKQKNKQFPLAFKHFVTHFQGIMVT